MTASSRELADSSGVLTGGDGPCRSKNGAGLPTPSDFIMIGEELANPGSGDKILLELGSGSRRWGKGVCPGDPLEKWLVQLATVPRNEDESTTSMLKGSKLAEELENSGKEEEDGLLELLPGSGLVSGDSSSRKGDGAAPLDAASRSCSGVKLEDILFIS